MKVDLFLGGLLGLWVLDQIDTRDIGTVYSTMPEIINRARKLGIANTKGDVGFSMHYPYLLKPAEIAAYKVIYNIHPGLLPWGRCYYPVFWSLWHNEPAGCTLHVIDEGIDTGPIVAQKEAIKYDWDTGGSLHQRVSDMEKGLFLEYWPKVVKGEDLPATPQAGPGSFHLKREFFKLKQNADYTDLIRLAVCMSHPEYSGVELEIGGRRYHLKAEEL